MGNTFSGTLTLLVFLPTLGALLLILLPRQATGLLFKTALFFTLLTFAWSLRILWIFDTSRSAPQLIDRVAWIPAYGIDYFVGVDGLNLFLVLLTTFLTPLVVLASWTVAEKIKEYLFFMLILETGMIGTFVALDLFLFYVFWEVMLIPMYFIIGVWGGPRRLYAALKFVLYTMSGSLLMLVAIIFLAVRQSDLTQTLTFDVFRIYDLNLPYEEQFWLFLAFALAFAIKVPVFPLHTWLPDAHVEAPTGGSVILAGVLLKMGTYGFLRFAIPLFPDVTLNMQPLLIALGVIGVVYGALVAMMQADLKKLVAYSSVSHLGLVVLGLFVLNSNGFEGALYQMLNHGISTGALFLLVGMIYERTHTRMIADFGGLWRPLPLFSSCFLVVTFSSVALPGLNGFIGEFLILLGAFAAVPYWAAAAASGMILAPIYMLWMFRRVIFGPLKRPEHATLGDLNVREVVTLAPILALIFVMGIYPDPFLRRMRPAIEMIQQRLENKKVSLSARPTKSENESPLRTRYGTQLNSSSSRG